MSETRSLLTGAPRGEREADRGGDDNAEMIEQVARYGRIRNAAIFVGNPQDIAPGTFGPGLPSIREWTEADDDFAGYVAGFDPSALGDRAEVRRELGYHEDEWICIVSVGGSAVGVDLLRRVARGFPTARLSIDGLRMIMVPGPRIDPSELLAVEGVECRSYVHELYRHLAVADVAVVQGGLTTTMELTACKVPFIYVPLRHHFEQNCQVRARLDQYHAGTYLPYEDLAEDNLAAEVDREVDYLSVETNGPPAQRHGSPSCCDRPAARWRVDATEPENVLIHTLKRNENRGHWLSLATAD